MQGQNRHGKLISVREEEESLNKQCPTHTVVGMFELYEQLLPTRLYAYQKTHTAMTGGVMCRLMDKAPESVAHVLVSCTALAQPYMTRRNEALKILFFEILLDLGLVETVPPWHSPVKPKSVNEAVNAQAFWMSIYMRSTKKSEQTEWMLVSSTTRQSKSSGLR